jgi:hypothetical protein
VRSLDHILAVLTVVGLAAGCGGKPHDPWLAPESEFRSTVSRIALITVQTPEELEDPDPVRALFDSLLTSTLGAAGCGVIPSSRASALWSHAIDSAGGVFDPNTGRADTMKVWAIQRYVLGRLEAEDSADAFLAPAIVIVRAEFREHKARWDGASQTIEGFGSTVLRLFSGWNQEGWVPALSLAVDVRSMAGRRLFSNRGGIELWAKPESDAPVPRMELFIDPTRNSRAVWLALRPIIEPVRQVAAMDHQQ